MSEVPDQQGDPINSQVVEPEFQSSHTGSSVELSLLPKSTAGHHLSPALRQKESAITDCDDGIPKNDHSSQKRSLKHSLLPALRYKKRESRFYGWKWGIFMGASAATCILVLDITLVVLASRKKSDKGVTTILTASDKVVSRVNLVLHLVINICSTLLLSASNYGMQVLSSPTRSDCDRAHSKGRTLDIGVLSLHNLRLGLGRRSWLLILLGVSSLPLHLIYNSSVYQVVNLYYYSISIVPHTPSERKAQLEVAASGYTKQLNASEFGRLYGANSVPKSPGWQNVVIVVDEIRFALERHVDINTTVEPVIRIPLIEQEDMEKLQSWENVSLGDISMDLAYEPQDWDLFGGPEVTIVKSAPVALVFNRLYSEDRIMLTTTPKYLWFSANTTNEWVQDSSLNIPHNNLTAVDKSVSGYSWDLERELPTLIHRYLFPVFHINDVFAHFEPIKATLVVNFPLMLTVTISTAIKVAVLYFILFSTSFESPLVTIGDAICSFHTRPDKHTEGFRNLSQGDYYHFRGNERIDTISQNTTNQERNKHDFRALRTRRYVSAEQRSAWYNKGRAALFSVYCTLLISAFIVAFVMVRAFPWGTASSQHTDVKDGFNGSGAAALSLLVNLPQLLISVIYVIVNAICTKWALIYEYNQFGIKAKPLRVSRPEGRQNGTYFLQLPFKWGILLNGTGTLIHWLMSQTVFLVRQNVIDSRGTWTKDGSVAAVGFSASALVVFVVVFVLLHAAVGFIGSRKFVERVPYAGSLSWVISAACHPPNNEVGPPLDEVAWGLIPVDHSNGYEYEQFSFSQNAIILPQQMESS